MRPVTALLRAGAAMLAMLALSGSGVAQNAATIAVNPGTTGNGPMGSAANHVSEHIYLASEIGSNMTISEIRFGMNVATGLPRTYNSVSIYLQTTANTTFTTGPWSTAGYTLVYSGPITFSGPGFAGVTLTTPFSYTTAAGNLQMMVTRLDNLAAAGPVMNASIGNSTSNTLATCRRFNGATPVLGTTSLTTTTFRAAAQFIDAGGSCTAFPKDFAELTTLCWEPNHAAWSSRNAANGYAAAGAGSHQFQFFNATAGFQPTITTPVFAPFGVTKQVNFDVAGSTYPGNAPDQIILEASSDGGTTWSTLATLDNAVGGSLNPAGTSVSTNYAPTTAAEWATRSVVFPAATNRLRWRGVSAFGNNVYIDNVNISDPPACPAPVDAAIANVTGFNADVSWACAGCTGSFIVEYGPTGFTPGTGATAGAGGTVVPSAASPATITVPAARTAYDVYVRQDCGGVYSTNSPVAPFVSGCGSVLACNYTFRLTDNFGDGWNGATIDVLEEGVNLGTLSMELPSFGCERTINLELCHDSALALVCTDPGQFPDEPGLVITDPFGGVVYEFRGVSFYPGNCAITYPNPATPTNLAPGSLHGSVVDCVEDPCIDPPIAGTLSSTTTAVCSTGGTVDLTYSGGTVGAGQTLVWQSATDGVTFSAIPGASGGSYTDSPTDTTYYRVIVTCGVGSDTSNVVMVAANTFLCYCAAAHPPGCNNGNITNVTLNTLNNSTSCNAPAYEAFSPSGSTTTAVQQGVSYSLSVTTDAGCIVSAWADWDQDGLYETTEWVQVALSSVAGTPSAVSFAVPLTAALGSTNIRIRTRFAGNPNGPTNACGNFGSGETEDYIITVDAAPPCLPATAVTISNVSSTSFDVNWTNGINSCGTALYTVEYGPAGFTPGTGTSLSPVTSGPVTISGLSPLTDYDVYVSRDCTPCGDGTGAATLAGVITYPDCSAAAPISCPFGTGTFGPNGPGAWSFVEPLFGFSTSGTEQLFALNASVLGTYNMTLTAAAGSSIVAVYIKPVGTCDPTGWTYVGTNQFTVQTFTFPVPTTGQYLVLVDPVSPSLPINTYGVSFICPVQNIDCASAEPIECGDVLVSTTVGLASNLPATACTYSTPDGGGTVWYSFTSAQDTSVVLSTCGANTVIDTRISVYTGADCNSLSCFSLSDDFGGACGLRSQLEFLAEAGVTYYIAVHPFSGNDDGQFELQVGCGPVCAPPANDACANAQVLTSFVADGSGVATTGDNSCAQNDAFTSCTDFLNNQGMWYSFNTGPNTIHTMQLLGTPQNGALTASQLNYAIYSGSCSGIGATGEVTCVDNGDGIDIPLTGLSTNTNYLLYVYNPGGTGFEGTFQVLLEHPGVNDAGISAINAPIGLSCGSFLVPVVVLSNFGEDTLTTVDIVYDLDGVTGPFTYSWTGSLPYLGTEVVTLPGFNAPYGTHTLNVTVQNPNGQPDEIPANNLASQANIDVTGEPVVIEITTDNDPSQLIWEIQDQAFQSVASSPAYTTPNTTVTTTACVSTVNGNCFSLFLFDFLGDGLSGTGNGNGGWRIRTTGGLTLLADDFNGTVSGTLSPNSPPASPGYTNGHEFCVPPGPSRIQTGECGIFNNVLLSKVFCTSVPGATSYQFEFSDPDAGFRRRIAVPRNWVRFSELQTSPLQPGTRYFARVRVDQGTSGFADDRFGAGCEMGLDPFAVPGCTGLVDDIGTPGHSCGVTKAFGGSDKIYAQPVVGATQYRFRFENAGEGYLRTVLRPNYICPLSWVTLPLQNGSTYDVKVEVLYNGAWSGYCGPTCTVTILNPPANGQQRSVEATTSNSMQVWPNPVRDGVVNLRLEGLGEGTQRISLEVYDLSGQRVIARDVENSGSVFNTVLDMDGFAGGLYLIHLNVDGVMHQQRVSVVK